MGNWFYKTLSVSELLEITSSPKFCKHVQREHAQVIAAPLKCTFDDFSRSKCSKKYRSSDISCCDFSRVILNPRESVTFDEDKQSSLQVLTSEENTSTYIHANYVDGFDVINKFICTQTPVEDTWADFWKMIWEQNSRVIVSLTDLDQDDEESYKYWNNLENSAVTIGRFVIKTLKVKEEMSFTRTQFQITNVTNNTSRELTHFWFTDWPDNSFPTGLKDFLSLLREVNREQYSLIKNAVDSFQPGPIVVHCATGVGWTGTFCAIDNALAQLKKEKRVSVPQTVLKVRNQRHSSVLLPEQYGFCYKVLEHVLQEEAKNQAAPLIPQNKRYGMYVPDSRRKEIKIV